MGHVSTLTRNVLETLLSTDLGFHAERSDYGPHAIHAFAAKFPPQLPRFFIEALTSPGQVVLDPMMGSGTTVVEAETAGRVGIGIDLDPLAVLITRAKAGHIPPAELRASYLSCVSIAQKLIRDEAAGLREFLNHNFDSETKEFIEYWFAPKTQQALAALLLAIRSVTSDIRVASMLRVLFSSIIITKSGGVSRARDLAHTRPHLDPTKPEKDAIHEFSKKCMKVLRALEEWPRGTQQTVIAQGDARALPLASSSVDCVVTSPPYANAIDYMRANKFSLVWFGYPIKVLSQRRSCYIGAEKLF
ncbi:MAG: DNA methyltransferase, partial [Chloroflexota bacterium]|nr:DNA methyltransferase [Chloroflexota bacterium]